MNPRELKNEIIELRMTEMEVREQLLQFLNEVHTRKLWKEYGHATFNDFFMKELGYDKFETRDTLVRLGLILPSTELQSENPAAQDRIDRLRAWRRQVSSRSAIAAYRILTNRSLLEIAEKNPATIDELRTIKGMGEKKCAVYGTEILGVTSMAPVTSWGMKAIGSSPSTSVHSP
ncbi:MAG: HRDC domain-containing protein [Bdellovibrionota bacterium]